jgi:hypothetical protein
MGTPTLLVLQLDWLFTYLTPVLDTTVLHDMGRLSSVLCKRQERRGILRMKNILRRKMSKYTLEVKFKKMQFAYTCRQSG